jgi:hypothetical protein
MANNTNTSASGGILSSQILPLNKNQIEDLLFTIIQGITGYEDSKIVIAYQWVPPGTPELNTDWLGFFLTPSKASNNPQVYHDPGGDGSDVVIEEYAWILRVSFFGPNSLAKAFELRAGLFVEQNRWENLVKNNIEVRYVDTPLFLPYLENLKWVHRADLEVRLTQIAKYKYNVLNVLSGEGSGNTEIGMHVTFDSNNARKKE